MAGASTHQVCGLVGVLNDWGTCRLVGGPSKAVHGCLSLGSISPDCLCNHRSYHAVCVLTGPCSGWPAVPRPPCAIPGPTSAPTPGWTAASGPTSACCSNWQSLCPTFLPAACSSIWPAVCPTLLSAACSSCPPSATWVQPHGWAPCASKPLAAYRRHCRPEQQATARHRWHGGGYGSEQRA